MKKVDFKTFRNYFARKASRFNKFRTTINRKRKQSLFNSIDSTKVFKTFKKKRSDHHKMNVSRNTSQIAKTSNIDFNIFESRNKQTFKIKNTMFVFFRFIHSSKVFKLDEKQSIKLRKNDTKLSSIIDTHRLTKEKNLNILSIRKKLMQQFVNTSLRKNTRISKQFKRFCFDYA